jgi:hypothetical protein
VVQASVALAALILALSACTQPDNALCHAQRIGALEETIGGPHAIGRVGDFLLENDQIRLIIADKGPGRVNLPFGGSLVDADLQRVGGPQNGNDQLAELLPGFMFVGLDPTDVEVVHDGLDGNPAEVDVTGTGDDLLEMVGLLDQGLVGPNGILQLKQAYRLSPGARYVEIDTTVTNTSSGAYPFPYLNPTQLNDLGFTVPGIENLQLSTPMGQLPLLGGEQNLFAPGSAGFNVHFAIEDSYATAKGFPAFPGMVVDYLASRGPGVSYGLTAPMADSNYVNAFADLYSNQNVTPYSMVIPFTYAGVSAVYMANPPAELGPGEQFTFTSYFVIGKGDVSSVADTIYKIRGTPTGTFGGTVIDQQTSAPLVGAAVIVLDGNGNPFDEMDTDANGAFLGTLPAGTYSYQVIADDRLRPPPSAPFQVTVGEQTGMLIQVAPPATIAVSAVDELGRHAPAKMMLVGQFPQSDVFPVDPRSFLYSMQLGERQRTTAFDGTNNFVENAWWTADGNLEATVRPGDYTLWVSRGPEYEPAQIPVTLKPGAYSAQLVQLKRSYASDGWISGDFHLHAQPSTDSGLPIPQRVITAAAEGLDVATATDHNFVTDYSQVIAQNNLSLWLLGIPGMELTTFEMGHFIGYPLHVDPGSTRGGEFEWAHHPPQYIFDELHTPYNMVGSAGYALAQGPDPGLVTVAHPRQAVLGYFAQFFIDSTNAQPYTPTGLLGVFAPYGPEFQASQYSYDFDCIELITGNHFEDIHDFVAPNPLPPGPFPDPQPVPGQIVVGPDGRPTFPGVVETWFSMLDRGLQPTGMGASDSHHTLGDEPGYARTMLYVGAGKDTAGGYTQADVIAAIRAHHAVATNAPLIEMNLGSGMSGDTIVNMGAAAVQIHVTAPSWAQPDTLKVYTNGGAIVATIAIPNTPGVPTDFSTTVTLNPTVDSWVVSEVTGHMNMFPIDSATEIPPLDATVIIAALSIGLDLSSLPITSSLKPSRTHFSTPYAITNPIRIDIDGNGWTPPQPAIPMAKRPPRGKAPDVRAQFEALPEWSP